LLQTAIWQTGQREIFWPLPLFDGVSTTTTSPRSS
jgi:hypothetical protein